MLARLRLSLQRMRYYAARRPVTPWTRARDAVIWAAPVLAILVAWLTNGTIKRTGEPVSMSGTLLRTEFDVIESISPDTVRGDAGTPTGQPVGTYRLIVTPQRWGWPITTRLALSPPVADLDLFDEPAPREGVRLAADDPIRDAIGRHLERMPGVDPSLVTAWPDGADHHALRLGWLAAIGVWWVLLTAVGAFGIDLTGYLWRIIRGTRENRVRERRSKNLCGKCGYDARGLEFRDRCPECGALLY